MMLDCGQQTAEVETAVHPSQTYGTWLSLQLPQTHVFRAVLLNMRTRESALQNTKHLRHHFSKCKMCSARNTRVTSRVRTADAAQMFIT